MRVTSLALALSCTISIADAQTVVDGSGSTLPETLRERTIEIVGADLKDPVSAQYRKLRLIEANQGPPARPDIVCGEVNARNAYGGYVGFTPFAVRYDTPARTWLLSESLGPIEGEAAAMILRNFGCLPSSG